MADDKEFELGYLRYGKPPESGISHNYRDNIDEAGVSVYRAKFFADGTYEITPQNIIQWYNLSQGYHRDIYRVWGEEVGIGSDGEPVLKVSYYEKIAEQTTWRWFFGRYRDVTNNLEPLSEYTTIAEAENSSVVRDIITQEAKDYEDRIRRDKTIKACRIYEIVAPVSSKPFTELTEAERLEYEQNVSDSKVIDEITIANYN